MFWEIMCMLSESATHKRDILVMINLMNEAVNEET